MLPWSDLGRPLTLRNRRDGDEGEAASLHRPFDNPHDAVREHGTYGGQGKAVGCVPPTALLFEEAPIGLCWRCWAQSSNYYPKTSNTSTSKPSEMITQTNSIVISICPSACASRFRAVTRAASKSVGMISGLSE